MSSIHSNLWNKIKDLHKKRVQLPQDLFGTPTWPPFYCFGTPIWPLRRHVKTLYRVIGLAPVVVEMLDSAILRINHNTAEFAGCSYLTFEQLGPVSVDTRVSLLPVLERGRSLLARSFLYAYFEWWKYGKYIICLSKISSYYIWSFIVPRFSIYGMKKVR